MLILSSLVATAFIGLSFSATTESLQDSYYGKKDSHKIYNSLTALVKSKNLSPYNVASDKDERTFLMPKMTHVVVPKKRNIKKYPRRTIQKIIKKTKKNRKTYYQVTNSPTQPTPYHHAEETTSTTQATQKKKVRKWNSKYARYPKPFQRLSSKKDFIMHRKNKRETDRDLYILQDLDEIEFLSAENDINAIRTNVKKYW